MFAECGALQAGCRLLSFDSVCSNRTGSFGVRPPRGKIDLICSPDLDPDDVQQIAIGYARRSDAIAETLIEQFDELLADHKTVGPARTLVP